MPPKKNTFGTAQEWLERAKGNLREKTGTGWFSGLAGAVGDER